MLVGGLTCPAATVVETYDAFGPDSKLTVRFDLNGDFNPDATFEGRLDGRIDVELELSEAAPLADLLEVRVKRMTLFAPGVMELAAEGFSATAHDVSLHLTDPDGSGSGGDPTIPTFNVGLGNYAWSQFGDNTLHTKGTIRAGGPSAFAELVDLAAQPPFTIPFYGCQWGWSDLGGSTTMRVAYQIRQVPLKTVFPITVDIIVNIAETKPFIPPSAPVDFAAWIAGWGLAGPEAEPNADPDEDGRSNLDEFAYDRDPTVADTSAPPLEVDWDGAWALYSFVRDTSRSGLDIALETSDDLAEWKTIALGAHGTDVYGTRGGSVILEKSMGGGRYLVVVRDGVQALGDQQRFARLRFSSR